MAEIKFCVEEKAFAGWY